jgi:preprotein translocase subunit SecF
MSVLTRMYRGETNFDFIAISKRTLIASGIAIVLSLLILVVRPLNLSIDFTGGTIVVVPNEADVAIGEVRDTLRDIGQGGARVQLTGEGFILVQTEALDAADQDELVRVVAGVSGTTVNDVSVDAVGPTFGAEVTRRAVIALLVFLAAVAAFISLRFEWKMAVSALAALFHDLIITAGIYALIGFPVTPATVIAILTILGYSLYDTVVVFDKVTENVHELHGRATYTEIMNLSLNQVLMRSINTSLTSLIPIGSLLFIGSFALGAETLTEFALALFIGVAIGTYSSIFIAAPLLVRLKESEDEWVRSRRRVQRRRGLESDEPEEVVVAETAVEAVDHGAVPRPPKQRRKRR